MRILIVGGTGMIGGHAALRLKANGHEVVIGGRKPPLGTSALGGIDFMAIDYIANDAPAESLSRFDAVVFAAGQDVRSMPAGADLATYMWRANAEAIPSFFARLREAGVRTAINIGTFYPQAAPAVAAQDPYMRSRAAADEAICAMADHDFRVFSINPPWVVGAVVGLPSVLWDPYLRYAAGLTDLPEFAPPGGCAYISCESLSDAIEGGLERGKAGERYLVNDENLQFATFLATIFEAFGRSAPPVEDRPHPVIVDAAISWGRGNTLFYNVGRDVTETLRYRRGDVLRTIREDMVPEFVSRTGLAG